MKMTKIHDLYGCLFRDIIFKSQIQNWGTPTNSSLQVFHYAPGHLMQVLEVALTLLSKYYPSFLSQFIQRQVM